MHPLILNVMLYDRTDAEYVMMRVLLGPPPNE